MRDFSWEDGLEVQDEQMERFEIYLKPEIYALLRKKVDGVTERAKERTNLNDPQCGYNVPRGTDLDMILQNDVVTNLRKENKL